MKKTKLLIGLLSAAFALGGLASCGGNDNHNSEPTSEAALTLIKIEIKTLPTKIKYEVDDTVDLTGMVVMATFSDGSSKDVTSDCKCNLTTISKDTTQLKISYEFGGKTKSAYIQVEIENPVKIEEDTSPVYPRTIVKESDADLIFLTYYDSETMQCDGVLELRYESETEVNKGAFCYTEQATSTYDENGNLIEKINTIAGTFTIADDQISFKSNLVKTTAQSAKFLAAYDEVATIKKNQNGDIIGLEMGKMLKNDDLFFGWGKTDKNKFIENLSTKYGYNAYEVYLERMIDHNIPDDMKFYHRKVIGLELVHDVDKKEYYTGELFDVTGLELKASFDIGKDEIVSLSEIALSKTDALTLEDNSIIVYYGGMEVTLSFTVSQPSEVLLTSLEIQGVDNTVRIPAYKEMKVKDAIAGYKAIAHYSDPTLDKEVTVVTTGLEDDAIAGETKEVSFSYTEGGITKNVVKSLTFAYFTPAQLASKTECFYTYFIKGNNKVNVAIELFDDSTFAFTAMMATSKYSTITGKYAVEGTTITFTEGVFTNVLGTSAMFKGDDETATVVKEGDKIIALNFGSLETEGFFGYTAAKDFNGSLATSYLESEDAIKTIYMVKATNEVMSSETVVNNIFYK